MNPHLERLDDPEEVAFLRLISQGNIIKESWLFFILKSHEESKDVRKALDNGAIEAAEVHHQRATFYFNRAAREHEKFKP